MVTSSLPIFILALAIPIMLVAFTVYMITKSKKPVFSGQHSRYITVFYCGLLLLSCAVVYTLPENGFITVFEQNQNISEAHELAASLLNIAKQGKLDSTPGIYKKTDLILEIKKDRIILIPSEDFDFHEIVIDRKDSDDGKIHAVSYMTPVLVQGMDITEKIQATAYKLNGDRFEVSSPARYALTYKSFKPDFTAEQFSSSLPKSISIDHMTFGRELLYLQIPKSMEVDANNLNVIYINDI